MCPSVSYWYFHSPCPLYKCGWLFCGPYQPPVCVLVHKCALSWKSAPASANSDTATVNLLFYSSVTVLKYLSNPILLVSVLCSHFKYNHGWMPSHQTPWITQHYFREYFRKWKLQLEIYIVVPAPREKLWEKIFFWTWQAKSLRFPTTSVSLRVMIRMT